MYWNTDFQSVRSAEFHSADFELRLVTDGSGLKTRWSHRPEARVPS